MNINDSKIKSYLLLIAYNIPEYLHNTFQKHFPDEELASKETIARYLYVDMYSVTISEEAIAFFNRILRGLLKMSIIEREVVLELFTKKDFKFNTYDLEIVVDRYIYLVNKYYQLNNFLMLVFSNYQQLKKHNRDLEIGSKRFHDIVLYEINKAGEHLTSNYVIGSVQQLLDLMASKQYPINRFILENLPFEILEELDTDKESKIQAYFKKKLTADLFPYIDSTIASPSLKELTQGLAFVLSRLIFDKEEYIQEKRKSDMHYEFDTQQYHQYVRSQGKNHIKRFASSW